jgi:ferredoxin
MRRYKDRTQNRTLLHMRTALLGTIFWGVMETTILNFVWLVDRHIWPQFHTRFMRLIHGNMGGIVTPSTIALEKDHASRNWESRTIFERVNQKGAPDAEGRYIKQGDLLILPTQEILNLILRSNLRPTVSYCFCREHAKKMDKECSIHAPVQTCLTLSFPQAVEEIAVAEPKPEMVAKQMEIYNLLKRCEQIGLVHQVIFYKQNSTYVICNCCPCCCEVLSLHFNQIKERKYHENLVDKYNTLKSKKDLNSNESDLFSKLQKDLKIHIKGTKLEPTPIVVKSAFISETSHAENCISCGNCEKRCYFDARYISHGQLHFNAENCVGCGLCISTCPKEVITLKRRKVLKKMAKDGKGIEHIHPHKEKSLDHIHIGLPHQNEHEHYGKK